MRQLFRPVSWSVNSQPVEMGDNYQFNSISDGGFDVMSGVISRVDARRTKAGQGSIVRASLESETLWEGRLTTIPMILADEATLKAQGAMHIAEGSETRRLYRSDDYSAWTTADSDPFGYQNADKITTFGGDSKLGWELNKGDDLNNGVHAGYVFWAQGQELSKIVLKMGKSEDDSKFDLYIRDAPGPSGSLSNVDHFTLGAANPSGTQKTTTLRDKDLVSLFVEINQSTSGGLNAKKRFWVTGLSVYGLTTSDSFGASDVIADVADALHFSTANIDDSGTAILPLDWDSGSWLELMLYIADLDDARVCMFEDRGNGPVVDYSAWDDTALWIVNAEHADLSGLEPQQLYSQATVKYETPGGVSQEVTVEADPNPLPDDLVNDYSYELNDRQVSDSLAQRLASTLIGRYSRQMWGGSITIADAETPSGIHTPQKIRGGDRVNLRGWDVDSNLELRVMDSQVEAGQVQLGIEQGVGLPALVADLEQGHHKRRRHHRHHRN